MNPDIGRPEMYLWQNISVPPVCIRPSVQQDGASNEDDITVKLTEVIFTNAHMQAGLKEGIAIHNLMVRNTKDDSLDQQSRCHYAKQTALTINRFSRLFFAPLIGTMGFPSTFCRHVHQQ